ncbi:rubrerythrin-like domain-containing protein [Halorussus halophilus]|uniref:rubrerythrin-like domain-containing protein n=1 Tax=Halorussus halophilus TaxID=2650975 RepID=UPI001301625F|nr:rubrerythrin-like domain-containing protein [Halorussus halophilus]
MAPEKSNETTDANDQPRDTFECSNCGYRTQAEHNPGDCPECGGEMQNISRGRDT